MLNCFTRITSVAFLVSLSVLNIMLFTHRSPWHKTWKSFGAVSGSVVAIVSSANKSAHPSITCVILASNFHSWAAWTRLFTLATWNFMIWSNVFGVNSFLDINGPNFPICSLKATEAAWNLAILSKTSIVASSFSPSNRSIIWNPSSFRSDNTRTSVSPWTIFKHLIWKEESHSNPITLYFLNSLGSEGDGFANFHPHLFKGLDDRAVHLKLCAKDILFF